MSSEESPIHRATRQQRNERKVPRACDNCRVKKTRCVRGDEHPDSPCTNCSGLGLECTYVEEAPKKFERRKGYINDLEERIDKLEKLFSTFNPGVDISKALDEHEDVPVSENRGISSIPVSLLQGTVPSSPSDVEDEWDGNVVLPDGCDQPPPRLDFVGYHGNAGIAGLIIIASKIRPIVWTSFTQFVDSVSDVWKKDPWESVISNTVPLSSELPPMDLINTLVHHYFANVNVYWPLLSRKFIEKDIIAGKHLVDKGFRTTLLLICAIAAKYTHDPRVFATPGQIHSRGWQWFHQAYASRPSLVDPLHLTDVHFYALSAQFCFGSSKPRACWTLISFGIKVAQNLGLHRRYAYKKPGSASDELWKRAFWVLVAMDRTVGIFIGRPIAIQDEDFDLDFPIECDDEYWDPDNPETPLKQPLNRPSTISYFNAYLRLQQIVAVALRTIYCINRSKVMLGFVGADWEQKIVSELDSALNGWQESGIPEHLRWDSNRPSGLFRDQSLVLQLCYHFTRILVHRPFILANAPAPSLSICANSARACARILQSSGQVQNPALMLLLNVPVFSSGIILLINIWKAEQSQSPKERESNKDLKLIHQCIDTLRSFTHSWKWAGMVAGEILHYLLLLEESSPQPTKRPRQDSIDEAHAPQRQNKRLAATLPGQSVGNTFDIPYFPGASGTGLPTNTDFWYPGTQVDPIPWSFNNEGMNMTHDLGASGTFTFDFPLSEEQLFYNDVWGQYIASFSGGADSSSFFHQP